MKCIHLKTTYVRSTANMKKSCIFWLLYVILTNFMVINGDPEETPQCRSIVIRVTQAVEKALGCFSREYRNLNLDALLGLRMAEGKPQHSFLLEYSPVSSVSLTSKISNYVFACLFIHFFFFDWYFERNWPRLTNVLPWTQTIKYTLLRGSSNLWPNSTLTSIGKIPSWPFTQQCITLL